MLIGLYSFLAAVAVWGAYEWGYRAGERATQHYIAAVVKALEDVQCTDGTTIGERVDREGHR